MSGPLPLLVGGADASITPKPQPDGAVARGVGLPAGQAVEEGAGALDWEIAP
jgi:hypothetical protein